jgi:hypothetical protein
MKVKMVKGTCVYILNGRAGGTCMFFEEVAGENIPLKVALGFQRSNDMMSQVKEWEEQEENYTSPRKLMELGVELEFEEYLMTLAQEQDGGVVLLYTKKGEIPGSEEISNFIVAHDDIEVMYGERAEAILEHVRLFRKERDIRGQ